MEINITAKMTAQKQAAVWGNFWQIVDLCKKLLNDYEQIPHEKERTSKLAQIETAYIDSIIVHIAKIFSNSKNEPFRLGQFKRICRTEIRSELNEVEKEYKNIIGKIVTNRDKLIAHLDERFYDLHFSENEIARMEQSMAERMNMSLKEAKGVYASMSRTTNKSKERYSVGDFQEDFPAIKQMVEKLDDIWSRSIPFAESVGEQKTDEERRQLAQEHKKKDDAVFKFFKEAIEDIGSAFAMDEQKRNYISERVQLICVFTFIDVIASYWHEYLGENGTQKSRFIEWIERYCLTKKNSEYTGTDFVYLTGLNFYAFRSSMVHFFGIAGLEGDYKISVATNRVSDDLIEQWRKGFREHGTHALIFKPKKLYNLILEGAVGMLGEWKETIQRSQNDEVEKWRHIEGIDRIYQKVQLEGAAKVAIPEVN